MKRIGFNDTTLRDGEQAPGVSFTPQEKRDIAQLLAGCGVDQIEAGMPAMSPEEEETIRSIVEMDLPVVVATWNRAVLTDIDASLRTGAKWAHLTLPASELHIRDKLGLTKSGAFDMIRRAVDYAMKRGMTVSVGLEDASRADSSFLTHLICTLYDDGVKRFRYADTVSALNPRTAEERIRSLVEACPLDIELEFHGHNDFGLATANTLAALTAGASIASTTVTGLGERAGNAGMEEVSMAWRHLYGGFDNLRPDLFQPLADYVSLASGRHLPEAQPIVGPLVYAHESGIHVDGLLKNRSVYQCFEPEEINREHSFMLGKHSGMHSLEHVLLQSGIDLNHNSGIELLKQVRKEAEKRKRPIEPEEAADMAREIEVGKRKQLIEQEAAADLAWELEFEKS
ncbi:MAG: homocysteine methyltransferase [Gorillibacterium sp.]|nr:homocysteine methyltransferase [Gorillibacterium sp.]